MELIPKNTPFLYTPKKRMKLTLWNKMMAQLENEEDVAIHQQIESFLRQLIWQEFSYYQLVHQPFFTTQPLRSDFLQF